ncbi:MAG: hemerythrin domain-containing protein [Sandaracinus sp.]|nr:hemerythrin domain-containing protein [Sandaracinus sp.]
MGDEQPKPSEVRKKILAEHVELRAHLDALDAIADRLAAGDDVLTEAREAASTLHAALVAHMKDEEAMLVPALAEADGFGPARAADLQREHVEQGEVLGALLREIGGAPGSAELESRIRELVRRIREDMAHEESVHLAPGVLKDSVVTTSFGG